MVSDDGYEIRMISASASWVGVCSAIPVKTIFLHEILNRGISQFIPLSRKHSRIQYTTARLYATQNIAGCWKKKINGNSTEKKKSVKINCFELTGTLTSIVSVEITSTNSCSHSVDFRDFSHSASRCLCQSTALYLKHAQNRRAIVLIYILTSC